MNAAHAELSLAPLGAGELIDRAMRLYRRHFLTLIRIVAPPVLILAVGPTLMTVAFRAMLIASSNAHVPKQPSTKVNKNSEN